MTLCYMAYSKKTSMAQDSNQLHCPVSAAGLTLATDDTTICVAGFSTPPGVSTSQCNASLHFMA